MADLEPEFNHVYNELARQVSRGVYRSRGVNGSRGVYRSRGVRGVHEPPLVQDCKCCWTVYVFYIIAKIMEKTYG